MFHLHLSLSLFLSLSPHHLSLPFILPSSLSICISYIEETTRLFVYNNRHKYIDLVYMYAHIIERSSKFEK